MLWLVLETPVLGIVVFWCCVDINFVASQSYYLGYDSRSVG